MGFLQSLGEGVARFLEERMKPGPAQVAELATRLYREGRTDEAVALFERDAGLAPGVYEERGLLEQRLRERLAGEDPNVAAYYAIFLAGSLGAEGRHRDSMAVMELDLGLEPGGFEDLERVQQALRARLAGLAPDMVVGYLGGMVSTLGCSSRFGDAVFLLERDLGLGRDPDRDEVAAALRRRVEALSPEAASFYTMGLANALGMAGREEEAAWIFQTALGLEDLQRMEPQDLRETIRERLAVLPPGLAASFVFHLTGSLEDRAAAMVALLEGFLDIEPSLYKDPARLAERLSGRLGDAMFATVINLQLRLASGLGSLGRHREALAVLQAACGTTLEEDGDPYRLGAGLRSRMEALPEDIAAIFVSHFASALQDAGKSEQAVLLLEGYAGLSPENYRSVQELSIPLDALRERWADATFATFLSFLLAAFDGTEETKKFEVLLETCAASFDLKDREGADFGHLPPLVMIYHYWLERFGEDPEKRPLEICRDLVLYLRRNIATHGVQLKDRAEFLASSGELRLRIMETALFWARRESDPERAGKILLDSHLWDAELGQRLLIERFLLEPILPVPPGSPPSRDWAWRDSERPESASHLPDSALAGRALGAFEESGASAAPPREASGEAGRLQKARPALFERAREIAHRGVDEARMAEAVGAGGTLLRATFDAEGRLLWSVLRSDGREIALAARGGGSPGDLNRIRWATARHDFRMALARFRAHERMPGKRVSVLRDLGQALDELLFELRSGPQARGYLDNRLDWISRRFLSLWRSDGNILSRFIVPARALLDPPFDPESFRDWAEDAAARVQSLRDHVSGPAPESLQPELDRVTAEYVEEIGRIWPLDALADSLSPQSDLVLQLDDALHAVPVAHLPVRGEPLFRSVRSLSSSLALLMTTLQGETEEEMEREQAGPGRLLSVSRFRPDDVARTGAAWLQHGFSVLAGRYGLEAYGAADDPAGTVGLLRTALEELRRFRVLAICGHGHFQKPGIELAYGEAGEFDNCLWDGGGCDLSGVDWLWMVSCSIGRLGQNGDRDVEGFCVQLALHRARSVAAFRWPVHSVQAVALVNEAVRLYLEALRTGEGDRRRLRAWALNEARKSFLGDGTRPPLHPHVGLNTAAACELFGLG